MPNIFITFNEFPITIYPKKGSFWNDFFYSNGNYKNKIKIYVYSNFTLKILN